MRVALRFAARALAWLLVALILVPILGFIGYDVLYFQSRRAEIRQMIASATEDERNPPETVVRVMRVAFAFSLPQRPLASEAAWVLLAELTDEPSRRVSSLPWQTRTALWWACVALHLSEQEQITLIVSRRYMGRGLRGFSAASQALLNRPLASISLEEAATLVAIYPMPNQYRAGSQSFTRRRDLLLSRLQNYL